MPVLDPASALRRFDDLVDRCVRLIQAERAPGFVLGISGTDSALAYLICARAFERLGQPERVRGLHYGRAWPPSDSPEEGQRQVALSPSYRWVPRILVPWLNAQVPGAQVDVFESETIWDDTTRWAALNRNALQGQDPTQPFLAAEARWVVGTRNATEDALGTYSNLSSAVSVQPLLGLWKSEVLALCAALGVPAIAQEQSRLADCDCGRFDLAAQNIEAIDALLQARTGAPVTAFNLVTMAAPLRDRLVDFIVEQTTYAAFKKRIPYRL
jgi:NH3-dependent NAD+ synthetase